MKEAGEITSPATIKAYPNPTNGNLSLELKGFAEGKARIKLFCSDGRPVNEEGYHTDWR